MVLDDEISPADAKTLIGEVRARAHAHIRDLEHVHVHFSYGSSSIEDTRHQKEVEQPAN